jgi:hypothetical protein
MRTSGSTPKGRGLNPHQEEPLLHDERTSQQPPEKGLDLRELIAALWGETPEDTSQVDGATERARRSGASVAFKPREGRADGRSVVQVPEG